MEAVRDLHGACGRLGDVAEGLRAPAADLVLDVGQGGSRNADDEQDSPGTLRAGDRAGRFAATVGAFMNMGAGLAGALAGWVTGSVLERAIAARAAVLGVAASELPAAETTAALLHGYHVNFYTFAVLYAVAFLAWFKIDPTVMIEARPSA